MFFYLFNSPSAIETLGMLSSLFGVDDSKVLNGQDAVVVDVELLKGAIDHLQSCIRERRLEDGDELLEVDLAVLFDVELVEERANLAFGEIGEPEVAQALLELAVVDLARVVAVHRLEQVVQERLPLGRFRFEQECSNELNTHHSNIYIAYLIFYFYIFISLSYV